MMCERGVYAGIKEAVCIALRAFERCSPLCLDRGVK